MSSTYERLSKRIGKKKARVAIARRLTEVVWHILTDMAEYRTQDKDLVQRKYKAAAAKARLTEHTLVCSGPSIREDLIWENSQ